MRYLTVVYNIPEDFDAREILSHEYLSAASWSHAIKERDHWKITCELEVQKRDTINSLKDTLPPIFK